MVAKSDAPFVLFVALLILALLGVLWFSQNRDLSLGSAEPEVCPTCQAELIPLRAEGSLETGEPVSKICPHCSRAYP